MHSTPSRISFVFAKRLKHLPKTFICKLYEQEAVWLFFGIRLVALETESRVSLPLTLTYLAVVGRAAPLLPRATTRVPASPHHLPCPYNDSEPLGGPRRRHSRGGDPCGRLDRGTYALASLENVSGREGLSTHRFVAAPAEYVTLHHPCSHPPI